MGHTVHGILQARILEWVALPFSGGSSQPTDWTQVSWIVGSLFTSWAIREALNIPVKRNKWAQYLNGLRQQNLSLTHTAYGDWVSRGIFELWSFEGAGWWAVHSVTLKWLTPQWEGNVLILHLFFCCFLLFIYLSFNWRKIALQGCVGFCHTTQCSHNYMCITSVLASLSSLHPTPPGHHKVPGWAPCFIQQLLTSYLFCTR